jgi:hypothetical protein
MNELTKKVLFDDLYCNTRYSIEPPEGVEQQCAVIWRDGEAKVIHAEEFITWQDEIENEDAALIKMLQKAIEINPSNVSSEINRAMCILENYMDCVYLISHPSSERKAHRLGMEVLTSDECPENSQFILPQAQFLGVRNHDGEDNVSLAILYPHLVVELKSSY